MDDEAVKHKIQMELVVRELFSHVFIVADNAGTGG